MHSDFLNTNEFLEKYEEMVTSGRDVNETLTNNS